MQQIASLQNKPEISMKTFTALLALLLVSGCATTVASSNERSVIIESEMMEAGLAQKLADAECAKHKRFARMSSKASYWERNYIFDCIL